MLRSCAFSVSRRSSSLWFAGSPRGLKVYTFELLLSCQERSGASSGLATSSLLFDRDVLFMRPPHCAVSWMVPFRDAKENLVTNRDDQFAIDQRCAANTLTFRVHAPLPHITHVNLSAQVVAGEGLFLDTPPLQLFCYICFVTFVCELERCVASKQRAVKFVLP
jgi:hypothetical protein